MIDKWTRIDNLPFEINGVFDFIREEAECLSLEYEFEAEEYVENELSKCAVFDGINKTNTVITEYDEHELCDGEEKPTYAVYIYFRKDLVEYVYNYFKREEPSWFI